MNSERIQKGFRWVTPITLMLLSALLACYLCIVTSWKEELKEVRVIWEKQLVEIKTCLSDFEKEVRTDYVPRREYEACLKGINTSLQDIKNEIGRLR